MGPCVDISMALVPAAAVAESLDDHVKAVKATHIGGRGRRGEATDVDAENENEDTEDIPKAKAKKVKTEPLTQLLTLTPVCPPVHLVVWGGCLGWRDHWNVPWLVVVDWQFIGLRGLGREGWEGWEARMWVITVRS